MKDSSEKKTRKLTIVDVACLVEKLDYIIENSLRLTNTLTTIKSQQEAKK